MEMSLKKNCFLHAYGTPRAFDEKEGELLKHGIARIGYIGRARSILIDAGKMVEFTLGKIEEDRLYLVKKDCVDLWSVSSSIGLIQENKFNSIRISLYVPRTATVRFSGNHVAVRGVRIRLFGLNLTEGFLETRLKTLNELELQGGYNYWMRFKKAGKGIRIEVLDSKESASIFNL
jgi:hypothetical protein